MWWCVVDVVVVSLWKVLSFRLLDSLSHERMQKKRKMKKKSTKKRKMRKKTIIKNGESPKDGGAVLPRGAVWQTKRKKSKVKKYQKNHRKQKMRKKTKNQTKENSKKNKEKQINIKTRKIKQKMERRGRGWVLGGGRGGGVRVAALAAPTAAPCFWRPAISPPQVGPVCGLFPLPGLLRCTYASVLKTESGTQEEDRS